MSKLTDHLKQPAPIYDKPWSIAILAAVLVALVLAIFQPFQFRLNSFPQLLLLLGFSLLVFVVTILFYVIIPHLKPSYFSSEKWTIGRLYVYSCIFLFATGIAVFLYEYVLIGTVITNLHSISDFCTKSFFYVLLIDMVAAITIGLIPLSISTYSANNRSLKRNLLEVKELNETLAKRLKSNQKEDLLRLEGSTKDAIDVKPNDILYIESSGNYVNIVYVEESKTKKKLLRSTIKQLEELLLPYPLFIRCHRAYIVNTNHLITVTGNAQGYKLSLHHTEEVIPVSRSYTKQLKESLK